ncbi:MAG: fused MFS/spermidine synthase, partial [Myxococcota bacterium]|nr:fused MFS/spermidine synthase [Myxococcota bacterium]
LSDPRVHVHTNDARNALLLTDRKFDAIVSQPSHPWSGGAAHLYTREFFELVQSRLSDDGVFVQWIGLGFVDAPLFRSLLASLDDVFAHVQVYGPKPLAGALFVASDTPFDVAGSAAAALAQAPEELAPFGVRVAEDLGAALLLDEAGVAALSAGAPLNRDGNNLLQTGSPRVLDRSLLGGVAQLVGPVDPLREGLPAGFDRGYLLRHLPPWRGTHLVASLPEGPDRQVAQALIRVAQGKREAARKLLSEALGESPRQREGRAALLGLSQRAITKGKDPLSVVASPLEGSEVAVVAGWQRLGRDASTVAVLEPALAAVPPRDPLAAAAYRLRAEWRVHGDDPVQAQEAIALADLAYDASGGDLQDLLLRARVCVAAGEPAAAFHTLALLSSAIQPHTPGGRGLAGRAQRFAKSIPVTGELVRVQRGLARRLSSQAREPR